MTEQQTPDPSAPDAPEGTPDPSKIDWSAPDFLLLTMVELANENDEFEIGMTVWVGGGMITGTLIGRTRWVKELMQTHSELRFLEGFADSFAKVDEANRLDPENATPTGYIHLKNASCINGASHFPGAQNLAWRGRLSAVSGWSFGRFDVS